MKRVNILSVIGLLLSFNFAVDKMLRGTPDPTGVPSLLTNAILIIFALSYLASIFDIKNSLLKLSIISVTFLAMIITGYFSVMVVMNKAYYPAFMGVNLAYIDFVLLLLLTLFWNSKKQ